jgi:hypothetical protein
MKEANHSQFTVEAWRRKENRRKKPNDTKRYRAQGRRR